MLTQQPKKTIAANLRPEDAMRFLFAEVKKLGADQADIIAIDSTHVSVSVRQQKQEFIERSESVGLGLRVFKGKRSAMVSVSDLSQGALAQLAERVVQMAKLAPEDPFAQIPDTSMTIKEHQIKKLDLFEDQEPDVELLLADALATEEVALLVPGVTNSEGADASYSKNSVWLANHHGFMQTYQTTLSSVSVSVLAEKEDKKERDYAYSQARYRGDLKSGAILGKEAAHRAIARLGAKQARTAQLPIVFEPRVAKSLVGIIISACNGAGIARKTSFLVDKLGQAICPPHITIMNDPFRLRGLGSHPFDAEGMVCQEFAVVKEGILESWLLDLRSANQLGLNSTGNASRGLSSPPSPSPHNIYLKPSAISPAELIADIKEGIWITETFGSGVNMVTGDYSQGASGFWIENGKLTYPVNEITIAGNLREMLYLMVQANDLEFNFATNAPTIRIDGMMVAGQ